jgi:hypothetical protein
MSESLPAPDVAQHGDWYFDETAKTITYNSKFAAVVVATFFCGVQGG